MTARQTARIRPRMTSQCAQQPKGSERAPRGREIAMNSTSSCTSAVEPAAAFPQTGQSNNAGTTTKKNPSTKKQTKIVQNILVHSSDIKYVTGKTTKYTRTNRRLCSAAARCAHTNEPNYKKWRRGWSPLLEYWCRSAIFVKEGKSTKKDTQAWR